MSTRRISTVVIICSKSLMMLFNCIFWLTGMVILAVGIWVEVYLFQYLEMSSINLPEVPFVLIGAGAFIILIGCLGCCCTIRGHSLLLYTFAGVLIIIFLTEFVAGIVLLVHVGKIEHGFKDGLANALQKYDEKEEKYLTDLINDLQQKGCHSRIMVVMDMNMGPVGGLALGFSFFQILGAILAIWIANSVKTSKCKQNV